MIGLNQPSKQDLKYQKLLNKEIEDLHKVNNPWPRVNKTWIAELMTELVILILKINTCTSH